ncbi:hypothetical protein SGFS_020090 [Streptomyces graminofaciens]|uniref:Uncharacterized protein n=1 Tax=Streptomyces graminofaciens TaxID=68212 RepID=A0ABN5VBQ6_9ACTN|nr:hypothetical protein SGFS_020090 [Streptomyces graminofaciens]
MPCGVASVALPYSPTADEKVAHGTGTPSGIMSTYNDPENTRSATGRGIEGQPAKGWPLCQYASRAAGSHDRVPLRGGPPVESRLPIRPHHTPCPARAANAWTAQETEDFGTLSMALPLCVCASGLIGEDLL